MGKTITVDDIEIISGDETSVKIIHRNILGINFDTKKQHDDYLDFVETETGTTVRGKTIRLIDKG